MRRVYFVFFFPHKATRPVEPEPRLRRQQKPESHCSQQAQRQNYTLTLWILRFGLVHISQTAALTVAPAASFIDILIRCCFYTQRLVFHIRTFSLNHHTVIFSIKTPFSYLTLREGVSSVST